MKKLIAVLLVISMFAVLAACAAPQPEPEQQPETKTEETEATEVTEPEEKKPEETVPEEPVIESVNEHWADDNSLNIIAIGNSFSDDTLWYYFDIAKALGVEHVIVCNLHIPGCNLNTHATNAETDAAAYQFQTDVNGHWTSLPDYKMSAGLKFRKWDFVCFQQQSAAAGMPPTYSRLEELVDYVRGIVGDEPAFVWNMTWAYASDYSDQAFNYYGNKQDTMYEKIVSATQDKVCTLDKISAVIPTGTAIQNARTSYLGDTMCRDTYHLDMGIGRYIAALTMFAKTTGIPIDDIEFMPEGVDEAMRAVAIESVKNAIANPFEVTPSQYTEKP